MLVGLLSHANTGKPSREGEGAHEWVCLRVLIAWCADCRHCCGGDECVERADGPRHRPRRLGASGIHRRTRRPTCIRVMILPHRSSVLLRPCAASLPLTDSVSAARIVRRAAHQDQRRYPCVMDGPRDGWMDGWMDGIKAPLPLVPPVCPCALIADDSDEDFQAVSSTLSVIENLCGKAGWLERCD